MPSSIPANVGIMFGDSAGTKVYGPGVVNELKNMGIFKSIVFPFKTGDTVDGVIKIDIAGSWKANSSNTAKGFLIGLSLYTLSPFIGPGMMGTHDASMTLSQGDSEILKYAIHVETPVSYGLRANSTEVSQKANALQTRKLAVEIANRINSDRRLIIAELKKNK